MYRLKSSGVGRDDAFFPQYVFVVLVTGSSSLFRLELELESVCEGQGGLVDG